MVELLVVVCGWLTSLQTASGASWCMKGGMMPRHSPSAESRILSHTFNFLFVRKSRSAIYRIASIRSHNMHATMHNAASSKAPQLPILRGFPPITSNPLVPRHDRSYSPGGVGSPHLHLDEHVLT